MKKPYKVLVIDDEEVIRDSCREILEGEGYELLTAENGATGLALIEEHKPDLILVDVKMPGISGIEVLTRTAEIDPTLVSIVITGYATMELAVECMKKGAFDFVAKPFTPEELRLITRRGLEKRRLVLETLALQKEKELIRDHFAIVVAHEMKTPIAAAVQNISLLVGGYAGELTEKQLALLQRVKNRLDNALAMLQTWLKLTRMDMDALRKKFELLHPLSAVQKAIELLQPKAQAKNIQIVTLFPDSCPDVWGDEGTLVEAISNLVDNAVKYSFENSTVSVKVENKGKEVWISVSDTGVGIDEEDLPFIFDGFYRAKTGKETEQGTGLGLAIAKRIVEAHFGRIKVESAPGKGSTFSIILPQARKKENHNASVDEKAKGGIMYECSGEHFDY
ncbi:MAG: ATP-binding response regulator [bacterium JZ-2024 1]